MPLSGHSLELVGASIRELQARSHDEILHGARDEDLAAARGARDPGAEMHRQSFELRADDLDLTGVKALAHGELERAQGAAYRDRAAHRTRRPVERREKAIARVVDLSPAETGELRTDESVVLCEQRAPSLVADAREELGRSDEVREQNDGG